MKNGKLVLLKLFPKHNEFVFTEGLKEKLTGSKELEVLMLPVSQNVEEDFVLWVCCHNLVFHVNKDRTQRASFHNYFVPKKYNIHKNEMVDFQL